MSLSGWIGVDLDGTLAEYGEWKGINHIGPPIPLMVARVKGWIEEGREVRIFTARVAVPSDMRPAVEAEINAWCETHLGKALQITNEKDFGMFMLYDDRCRQVITNSGQLVGPD